jgi:hypothetical protein
VVNLRSTCDVKTFTVCQVTYQTLGGAEREAGEVGKSHEDLRRTQNDVACQCGLIKIERNAVQ